MEKKTLEILAPAGSFDSLKAAVMAGADAVYMGGSRFGARAYAENPEGDRLLEAIDYAHLYGVKLYLTVNTLLKDRELSEELYRYLKPCYERGLDAVIVQDLGVMRAIRRWFPDLPIHASTQMTICGVGGARILKEEGADRIVLARELSLPEIAAIHQETNMEMECFVHGALCYCYSGQCLFSSILGGRSGNRGRCAQPCRLSYDALDASGRVVSQKGENALLSPKDICALELLPQIAEAGVYSLKIEGRMKRPEYVAGVVRIYRKYADLYLQKGAGAYRVEEEDRRELHLLFNRDGFSRGYYEQHNGRRMMALKNLPASEAEKKAYEELIRTLRRDYVEREKKIGMKGTLTAREGTLLTLKLEAGGICLTVQGDPVQRAQNRPMEAAQLEKQLRKTGNTPFEWDALTVLAGESLFVPVQSLNQLRRDGLERLREALLSRWFRKASEAEPAEEERRQKGREFSLHISVETRKQLETVLRRAAGLCESETPLTAVYLEAETLEDCLPEALAAVRRAGLQSYVTLPPVFRMETAERFERNAGFWRELPADGYVIKNLEEYEFLRRIGWEGKRIGDHNLYTFNRESRNFWREAGLELQTNPLELNGRELRELSAEDCIQIIYGRYPMMTTAGCIHKTLKQCRKQPEQWTLKDRYQKRFPVKNYCKDCYNVIFNSQPLCLMDQMDELKKLGAGIFRIMFTTEGASETENILDDWVQKRCPEGEFTRGHFKRGVE